MNDDNSNPICTAFEGQRCIASGSLPDVALKVKKTLAEHEDAEVTLFDDATGKVVEVDFRGTPEEVAGRLQAQSQVSSTANEPERRGPGRPKLGVVAREVTLLPRHWDWLNDQPGGASVALRKLVEEARRSSTSKDRDRKRQEAVYRIMSTMAGDLPGYEEALRAFYRGELKQMDELMSAWPNDIRAYIARLAS